MIGALVVLGLCLVMCALPLILVAAAVSKPRPQIHSREAE